MWLGRGQEGEKEGGGNGRRGRGGKKRERSPRIGEAEREGEKADASSPGLPERSGVIDSDACSLVQCISTKRESLESSSLQNLRELRRTHRARTVRRRGEKWEEVRGEVRLEE